MFNENYYQNRLEILEKKFQTAKDRFIDAIGQVNDAYWSEVKELQQEYQQLKEIIKKRGDINDATVDSKN